MTAKKIVKKTPTEEINFSDQINAVFGDFAVEFLPFVEWIKGTDGDIGCNLLFATDTPEAYENKWGRQQWKMEVIQAGHAAMLSGGKRLWATFKAFLLKQKKLPTELPLTTVKRLGDGFSTQYEFKIKK